MALVDERPVFFFDIDNCLYSRSAKVHDMMKVLINKYFMEHLQLTEDDARYLHETYYKNYGLAIEGLQRHHRIDCLEYNRKVDDALPLENVLKSDPELRQLLESIDKSKVKLWLFTNAYITHGRRVERLLGIEGIFEGITYCDYGEDILICKPKAEAFERAMRDAGVMGGQKCYFIDDSYINCVAAANHGWGYVIHKLEPEDPEPETPASAYHIRDMKELKGLFPDLFKT